MRLGRLALIFGALAVTTLNGATANDRAPVLVELFTSEGCSSCPAADTLAGQLTQRDDVFVLSFHIDYWDYIGWKDRFASKQTTDRQHAYARTLGQRSVYTPEMVIAGISHRVGSDAKAVQDEIDVVAASRLEPPAIRVGLARTGAMRLAIGDAPFDGEADVLFVRFHPRVQSNVDAGENAGLVLSGFNVVKSFHRVGGWSGDPVTIEIPKSNWYYGSSGDGCAVIVQASGQGAVLGFHEIDMETLHQ